VSVAFTYCSMPARYFLLASCSDLGPMCLLIDLLGRLLLWGDSFRMPTIHYFTGEGNRASNRADAFLL